MVKGTFTPKNGVVANFQGALWSKEWNTTAKLFLFASLQAPLCCDGYGALLRLSYPTINYIAPLPPFLHS